MDSGAILARLTEIEERTTRLEDIEQARGLLHRYAAALDDPVPEILASLFTEDGTLQTSRGDHIGRDAITQFFRDAKSIDSSVKRHFVMIPDVQWLSPGRVELTSYFMYTARDAVEIVLGWGTYSDVVEVRAGRALFASMAIAVHDSGLIGARTPVVGAQVNR